MAKELRTSMIIQGRLVKCRWTMNRIKEEVGLKLGMI